MFNSSRGKGAVAERTVDCDERDQHRAGDEEGGAIEEPGAPFAVKARRLREVRVAH